MVLTRNRFLIFVFLFLGLFIFSAILILSKGGDNKYQLKSYVSPTPSVFTPNFYPGLSWIPQDKGIETQLSNYRLYYFSPKLNGDVPLSGKEWVARKQNMSENELLRLREDFRGYYDRELYRLDWNSDIKTNGFLLQTTSADGPTGSIWGYVKVDNKATWVFILQTTQSSLGGTPPPSLGCPCNIEFRIFISSPVFLGEVLPSSL